MWYCIDSIEDGVAVLQNEEGEPLSVPAALCNGCKEGDWGRYENGVFSPDPDETARRRADSAARLSRLLARHKKRTDD